MGLMWLVILAVRLERDALQEPRSTVEMLTLLCLVAAAVRSAASALTNFTDDDLKFEEEQTPAIQELGLHRDGVVPIALPPEGFSPEGQ